MNIAELIYLRRNATECMNGTDGKTAYEIAKELDPSINDYESWRSSLIGVDGADGLDGDAGADGRYVSSITLKRSANGIITNGEVKFNDGSVSEIIIITSGDVLSPLSAKNGTIVCTDKDEDIIAVMKL